MTCEFFISIYAATTRRYKVAAVVERKGHVSIIAAAAAAAVDHLADVATILY